MFSLTHPHSFRSIHFRVIWAYISKRFHPKLELDSLGSRRYIWRDGYMEGSEKKRQRQTSRMNTKNIGGRSVKYISIGRLAQHDVLGCHHDSQSILAEDNNILMYTKTWQKFSISPPLNRALDARWTLIFYWRHCLYRERIIIEEEVQQMNLETIL